jgi:hypothetical protein
MVVVPSRSHEPRPKVVEIRPSCLTHQQVADVSILLRVLHSAFRFRPIDSQMIEVSDRDVISEDIRNQTVHRGGEVTPKISSKFDHQIEKAPLVRAVWRTSF